MTDPIAFESATARHGFPLLFAAQSQKEVLINESLSTIDFLLHGAFEAKLSTPPPTPIDGQVWLVGADPGGEWAGREGYLACRNTGQWLFVSPRAGMRLRNAATGQDWCRAGTSWIAPATPAAPTGGATVDSEARCAIVNLMQSLRDAGVLG